MSLHEDPGRPRRLRGRPGPDSSSLGNVHRSATQVRCTQASGRERIDVMLYMVHMQVDIPTTLPKEEADRLKAEEKAYAQKLQHEGKWRHLWRIAGQYANYS